MWFLWLTISSAKIKLLAPRQSGPIHEFHRYSVFFFLIIKFIDQNIELVSTVSLYMAISRSRTSNTIQSPPASQSVSPLLPFQGSASRCKSTKATSDSRYLFSSLIIMKSVTPSHFRKKRMSSSSLCTTATLASLQTVHLPAVVKRTFRNNPVGYIARCPMPNIITPSIQRQKKPNRMGRMQQKLIRKSQITEWWRLTSIIMFRCEDTGLRNIFFLKKCN